LTVIDCVDGQEVSAELDEALSLTLPLYLFDGSIKSFFSSFGHLGSLPLLEQLDLLVGVVITFLFAIELIIENQEKLAGGHDNLGVIIEHSLRNYIDCFVIVPNLAFIELNHHVECTTRGALILILNHCKDEVL